MSGLARLNRPLDRSQHLGRENPPYPPAMFNKMFADAPDAHIFTSSAYQLPDAPPPPKLPPPPLNPPLEPPLLEPLLPEYEPPPPDHAMVSANIVKIKAITPAMPDPASEPARNQASAATAPPVATEPSNRPSE